MDQLDEETFLDELMSLRRQKAPAYPGSAMMISDLLFYGGDRSGMELAARFGEPMAPLPAAPPHRREEFNFDCLSEVCNPYRSGVGVVPGPAVVHAAGHTFARTLHDAMEDHGGWSSSSPTFVFGEGAAAARECSEMRTSMIGGVVSITHSRNNKLSGGAPSKNLMAERPRRKRLNDRLSILRSIVPKITKMDRTAILGDTIDYLKELTERIRAVDEEIGATPEELNLLSTTKNFSSSSNDEEMPMRNSTKFFVEKQGNGGNTRIEICCATSPGALISTVSALDELGLEIEQCVVSCFGDFAMQASCSQERNRVTSSTDEIKQALFTSAGYGGRCL